MSRRGRFARLPLLAKAVLITLTPFALTWIAVHNVGALINSVARFWSSDK
jgi:hypothetical protein